ncbi:uncharacterized protein ARMOST_12258 [Armillaria ostoyae]|uniref:Uncharacterized protein n=1 Tax=Armillaria ostoyae TaxID=47428 RepID=A0A284RJE5_ARMOS|nr:uncharacterized protein ARMOST_12258 [Armillaria ostoyae]
MFRVYGSVGVAPQSPLFILHLAAQGVDKSSATEKAIPLPPTAFGGCRPRAAGYIAVRPVNSARHIPPVRRRTLGDISLTIISFAPHHDAAVVRNVPLYNLGYRSPPIATRSGRNIIPDLNDLASLPRETLFLPMMGPIVWREASESLIVPAIFSLVARRTRAVELFSGIRSGFF